MDYLIHFNKNHSSKDGRFVSGDGDGDGQVNDNANRSKKKGVFRDTGRGRALKRGVIATAAVTGAGIAYSAAVAAGEAYCLKRFSKAMNNARNETMASSFLESMWSRAANAKFVGGDWRK